MDFYPRAKADSSNSGKELNSRMHLLLYFCNNPDTIDVTKKLKLREAFRNRMIKHIVFYIDMLSLLWSFYYQNMVSDSYQILSVKCPKILVFTT